LVTISYNLLSNLNRPQIEGRRFLGRFDFNVPLDNKKVSDDTRIRAAIPTIEYVLDNGGSWVMMSHLGRPKGRYNSEHSLLPVFNDLSRKLPGRKGYFVSDCVGRAVTDTIDRMQDSEFTVLENTRFHPEEEGYSKPWEISVEQAEEFARTLSSYCDVFVNDAFGVAHRAHASNMVTEHGMGESYAGFLIQKETEYLGDALTNPERPLVAVLGGSKVSGKIDVIYHMIDVMEPGDSISIGGGMSYAFEKAVGHSIGKSIYNPGDANNPSDAEKAKDILAVAADKGIQLLHPLDHVIADEFSATANTQIVPDGYEDPWMGMDIGPETIELYTSIIAGAKTVVWNGPMGVFEMRPFAEGTYAITRSVAEVRDRGGISIIGGGDSVAAVNKTGLADRMSHISTGGGASLEFLEGKILPGLYAVGYMRPNE